MARYTKQRLIGTLLGWVAKGLSLTLTIQRDWHHSMPKDGQHIFVFWHEHHFLPIAYCGHHQDYPIAGMVSASKDGEILARFLEVMSVEPVRGSSNRKGVQALKATLKTIRKGNGIAIACDGPRGPRHEVKPGPEFVARKTGLQIVPVGCAYQNAWVFNKAWDKFKLPKPFSKAAIYFGEPIQIEADHEDWPLRLAEAIHASNEIAKAQLT